MTLAVCINPKYIKCRGTGERKSTLSEKTRTNEKIRRGGSSSRVYRGEKGGRERHKNVDVSRAVSFFPHFAQPSLAAVSSTAACVVQFIDLLFRRLERSRVLSASIFLCIKSWKIAFSFVYTSDGNGDFQTGLMDSRTDRFCCYFC